MNKRFAAYAALFVTAFGWSLSPICIRYLSHPYDPFSQAFIRYSSALCVLIPISLLFYRDGLMKAFLNPATFGLAVMNTIMQVAWTFALYSTTATIGQLVVKLQVPFIILFSFFLFREERNVIRSPMFLLGTLLGIFGVVGVLIDKPDVSLMPTFNFATGLLIIVALSWSVYAVWGKHTVSGLHPVPMFTVVAFYVTSAFGIMLFTMGEPHTLLEAGPRITTIALLSGTLPIAIAHCAFHFSQKELGSAFCTSIIMLNPLLTHLIALMIWRDESMYWIQWVGTAMLLTGAFMVIRAEWRATGHALEINE